MARVQAPSRSCCPAYGPNRGRGGQGAREGKGYNGLMGLVHRKTDNWDFDPRRGGGGQVGGGGVVAADFPKGGDGSVRMRPLCGRRGVFPRYVDD